MWRGLNGETHAKRLWQGPWRGKQLIHGNCHPYQREEVEEKSGLLSSVPVPLSSPDPVSDHFLGAKFWTHGGWTAWDPCLLGETALPASQTLVPSPGEPSRGEKRRYWVSGRRPDARPLPARPRRLHSARPPPRPRRAAHGSGLSPFRRQGPAPGDYRARAASDCPCCSQRPADLPRRPCLFTRRGAWDRAAAEPPGEGPRRAAAVAPGATAPSGGARGADRARPARKGAAGERAVATGAERCVRCSWWLGARLARWEPSPVPTPGTTFYT